VSHSINFFKKLSFSIYRSSRRIRVDDGMNDFTQYSTISVRKIILESLRLCFNNYDAVFPPFLLTSIVESLLWKVALDMIPSFEIQPGFTENFLVNFIQYLTFVIPLIILFALASWVIDAIPNGLATKYFSERIERRHISFLDSLRATSPSIPRLMLLGLISGILILLGSILLIFPGIIIAVIFSLAIQAMIIEGSGVCESLRKSKNIVLKKPWQASLILLFLLILMSAAGFLGENICARLMIGEIYLRLAIIFIMVSIVKPLQPAAFTYLYYSLSGRLQLPEIYGEHLPSAPTPYREGKIWIIKYHPNFCYKCGQRLPPDALYCPRCGVRVKP